MADLPLTCPRCSADLRDGRLSSAIDPSAIVLRWQAAYVVKWIGNAGEGGYLHDHVGWLCPEMCGEFVPTAALAKAEGAGEG